MSTSSVPAKTRQPSPSAQPKRDRLSRSQALLITAGLAGIVGLSSGLIMRFSLTHSSSARFLSPLQTFPDLPDWAPELPQGTADSHYLPGGGPPAAESADLAPLDSVVERTRSLDTGETVDSAPTDNTDAYSEAESSQFDSGSDSSYDPDAYIEAPPVEAPPAEESYVEPYPEEPYVEEPYVEPYPEEPYVEDEYSSENYPATEASPVDEGADYDNAQY